MNRLSILGAQVLLVAGLATAGGCSDDCPDARGPDLGVGDTNRFDSR